MIRGAASLALGIAIGAMFRDAILDGLPGSRRKGGLSERRAATSRDRGRMVAGETQFPAKEVRLDEAGSPIRNMNFAAFDSPTPAFLSFKSLADCFDGMFADHEALRIAIVNYANDHRSDPRVPKLLAWWTQLGNQLSFLVREAVLNDPEVNGAIDLIRQNSEDLTQVSKQFEQATATIQGINRGLSLVGALASLFKK